MAEKLEPYRKITAEEIADRTGGGRGLFRMRHQRMKERAAQKINTFRERHVRGEVLSRSAENLFQKSQEHQQQLQLVNEVLQSYCSTIGVPFTPIPLHAMRTISEREKHPETYHGIYEVDTGLMYIDNELRGFRLFWTMLHEAVHAIGRTTFNAEGKNAQTWSRRRVGYQQYTAQGRQFSGLNEGVVELIVYEIVGSKYNEISQKLHEIKKTAGVEEQNTDYEIRFQAHEYDSHRSLVRDVIKREAYLRQHEHEGESDDDTLLLRYLRPVELEMIQGYLSGNMMHLRSIERHFGEGSLQFIAALKGEDGYGSDRGALFLSYFATLPDEWSTRLRIASDFMQNSELFALYLRSSAQVRNTINSYCAAPFPAERTQEYEQHIGLACGVLMIIERTLRTPAGVHSRKMYSEYKAQLDRVRELREKYMETFHLNPNDVPVLTERPERHLTIKPGNT